MRVATDNLWIPAGRLIPGHQLGTATNTPLVVVAVATVPAQQEMYNLTVTTFHTYYVIAGTTPVLVHNEGGGSSPQMNGSVTVWRSGAYRIDVENGPGGSQMHFQIQITNKKLG